MRGVVHPATLLADVYSADEHGQAAVRVGTMSRVRWCRKNALKLATGDRCSENRVNPAYLERSIIARDRETRDLGTSLARDVSIPVTRHFSATGFRINRFGFWRHALGTTRI